MNDFGENLKKLRRKRGLSQTKLAGMVDVTEKSVINWESGKAYPNLLAAVGLCQIFGVTIEELVYGRES